MNKNITTLYAVLALLICGCTCDDAITGNIELDVFPSSSIWWIAIDPLGDGNLTAKVEVQEASSSDWTEMLGNPSWGFWQTWSNGNGFNLPMSFRLTSDEGEQLVMSNLLSTISGGSLIQTNAQYSTSSDQGAPTDAPTNAPTEVPTDAPTPTQADTHQATQSPTQVPTRKPTDTPTAAPTRHPTQAPTQKPTNTAAPTAAPTQKPTEAPTQAPTAKPTSSGSSSGSSTDLCTVSSTSSEPLKLLVPLYVDPGSEWDELITAAATGVPIIAIINPDNGPISTGPDSSYTTYMQKFADAGIEMVGYVHTSYGDRALSDVEADVNTYATQYIGLAGIFVDEVSADASELSYYTSLYSSIISHSGYTNAIINPGTQPDEGYLNVATNIVIFESPGSQLNSQQFASWVSCAPSAAEKAGYKYKFSGIAYASAQSTMQSILEDMQSIGMGFVFVTDGASGCCTYNDITSYFAAEAAAVLALN